MIEIAFYVASAVALFATTMVISNTNPVHALLYLVVSLLAIAMVFFTLGAPFAGVLEVIIYAGAIMVLFVFVVMMLNLGHRTVEQERQWLRGGMWIGPVRIGGDSARRTRGDAVAARRADRGRSHGGRPQSGRRRAVWTVSARGRTRVDAAARRTRRCLPPRPA